MHVAKECGDSTALAAIFGDMAAYLKEPACDTFGMSQHDHGCGEIDTRRFLATVCFHRLHVAASSL